MSPVTLKNYVVSAFFGVEIDIESLCAQTVATLSPGKNTDAARLGLLDPSVSARVYRDGKVILTGIDSDEKVREALGHVLQVVKGVAPRAHCTKMQVENIVGRADLGYVVNLQMAADWMKYRVGNERIDFNSAQPEKGLRFVPDELLYGVAARKAKPSVTVLLYASGRMILSGAQYKEDLDTTWMVVQCLVKNFA
jgi:transcription initiation factor TFIID TATA-box-binding protein